MAETQRPEDTGNAMILGEMRGQLREVVHSLNNLSTKFDGLSREVVGLGAMASDLGDLKARVKILEDKESRNEGAHGAWVAILKSPAIGWLVGAALTVWALLSGKPHP